MAAILELKIDGRYYLCPVCATCGYLLIPEIVILPDRDKWDFKLRITPCSRCTKDYQYEKAEPLIDAAHRRGKIEGARQERRKQKRREAKLKAGEL